MDLFDDLVTRHQWLKIIGKILDKARTNSPTKQELLKQFFLLSLDAMKRHANWYISGDPLSDNVPIKANMDLAVLDPENNTNHKACFFKW
eukprot:5002353-Ditylum_brightwellii.AAC.1